ncbi:zinc-dependent alcohol dehydrogenase [Alkalibacillus haloalkaliphilus]|uniref:Alcohol dehydrogenase n=1 Tax=Alkalibacillus haloalkaliphilus TaxID=94136 RepID=A0A511W254_9BACI|nr:alcohol dehydrogenase catalytic domain-containing protein [Alkalibacillus haloalkaliphilus]GEN45067.1 alcohol dehydrogenase [Alkalibacillus haloalkaliphilus]
MGALQFNYNLPRYVMSKVGGKFKSSIYWNSRLSCLKFVEDHNATLPNEQWVKIKVKYSGICGSDLNLILLNDSPATSPFASFPFTIGHEIVGEIEQIGEGVTDVEVGDRVVIDPVLSCEPRGIQNKCPQCKKGNFSLCIHKTEGDVSPGLLIGACRDTGGGWSTHVVAHKSQVFRLPNEVSDLNGVMVEPFSCALHSVMRNPPKDDDTVLIIGGGVIGIAVIAAIRALDIKCNVIALVKHNLQRDLSYHYGANKVVNFNHSTYVEELSDSLEAKVLNPIYGSEVIEGGADIIYECVGRKQSVHDALRFTKSGGQVVLIGLAGIMERIDWTTVWMNELKVKGCFAYSREFYKGKNRRTFDIAIDLMQQGKVDLSPLVTHHFPLEEYRQALETATKKGNRSAVKVVFEPN